MTITFYTTHCPKCTMLKKKLDSKKIEYVVCDNVDLMLEKGIKSAPFLGVGEIIDNVEKETLLNFQDSWAWCGKQQIK